LRVAPRRGGEAVVVDVGGGAVVVCAGVVVVSVLVVVVVSVVVVSVLVVVVVSVVSVLVVGSVVVGGESARAAAAAPLPKRTTVASVGTSFFRPTTPDYGRLSNALLNKRSSCTCRPRSYPHAGASNRPSGAGARSGVGRTTTSGENTDLPLGL